MINSKLHVLAGRYRCVYFTSKLVIRPYNTKCYGIECITSRDMAVLWSYTCACQWQFLCHISIYLDENRSADVSTC